jgi:predicted DNA-binding transcriptional regulator AlpA
MLYSNSTNLTLPTNLDLPEQLQKLIPIAESMGVALYQRFSEDEAIDFLNISTQSLILLRGQGKISFIALPDKVEYFGYQLLEYLIGAVNSAITTNNQSFSNDRIIRAKEVVEMTGLSRTTIWRMERYKSFPARVSLGKNSVGWKLSDVQKWVDTRNNL